MRSRQRGFTLVEIAVVLVIIGLLLGGVLKGQELINSAKVKNLAQDFRTIPLFVYGYQDKFRALPGDDSAASSHLCGNDSTCTTQEGDGNGAIDGNWYDDADSTNSEAFYFWQHVRLANLASGSTKTVDASYLPRNADGGKIGIQSGGGTNSPLNLKGTYVVCSTGVLGKYVKQLDTTMDDGDPSSGSMRAGTGDKTLAPATSVSDASPYTVCLSF